MAQQAHGAGRVLLRQLPDGELCLYDIRDGELRASTRLSARMSREQHGLYTAAPNLPPMAVCRRSYNLR